MPFINLFPPLAYPVVQHRTEFELRNLNIPLGSHQLSGFRFVGLLPSPQTSSHTKSLSAMLSKPMSSVSWFLMDMGYRVQEGQVSGTTHARHWRVCPCDA